MEKVRFALAAIALAALAVAGACGNDGVHDGGAAGATEAGTTTLRLGYFPNVTHAPAVVGVEKGIFADALGDDELEVKTFNAGPSAVEALFAGAIDATFIGPNPAINAFVTSKGKAIRIVAGATSGGASLVVKPDVTSAKALKGKKLASPQLGGTQDVALRHWLSENGLKTDPQGGGDVSILPQENAQTLETFVSGEVAGAWVPEPWATRLVQEGGGKVLVDEATLWPGGRFVTTHLIVRTEFLEEHPDTVRRLVAGTVDAVAFTNTQPDEAKRLTNEGIARIAGKALEAEVIEAAWERLTFTTDPIASSLKVSAAHAKQVGLLDDADLDGIYALDTLNQILTERGEKEVQAP
ncbi:MAG TPA: ABC transporter substrate-binding protein [Acidimicrobiales bacterium]